MDFFDQPRGLVANVIKMNTRPTGALRTSRGRAEALTCGWCSAGWPTPPGPDRSEWCGPAMSESTTQPNRRRRVWFGGLIALVVLAVLGAVSVGATSSTGRAATAGADLGTQARLAAARRIPGDPLALGRPDAPVVISEWGDFQCPFCRAYTLNTEPSLVRQYVDSGRVRLEWHDFAYLGPESVLAARAARAAGRQGHSGSTTTRCIANRDGRTAARSPTRRWRLPPAASGSTWPGSSATTPIPRSPRRSATTVSAARR